MSCSALLGEDDMKIESLISDSPPAAQSGDESSIDQQPSEGGEGRGGGLCHSVGAAWAQLRAGVCSLRDPILFAEAETEVCVRIRRNVDVPMSDTCLWQGIHEIHVHALCLFILLVLAV